MGEGVNPRTHIRNIKRQKKDTTTCSNWNIKKIFVGTIDRRGTCFGIVINSIEEKSSEMLHANQKNSDNGTADVIIHTDRRKIAVNYG